MNEPGRVAVVVVAGVGDNPRGDAAERVTSGLTLRDGWSPASEHTEWFKVDPGRADPGIEPYVQPVQRFSTSSPGQRGVDLYELWWADLSRFSLALRSFLAAFVGLFLAFPSIGRTALRDGKRIGEGRQPDPAGSAWRNLDFHLLGVLHWLTAVPVVVLTATMLMTVGAVVVAVALPDAESPVVAAALATYGAGLTFVGLKLLRRYERESGRRPAFWLGVLAVIGAGAVFGARFAERGVGDNAVTLSLADTMVALVAFPMRVLWLVVLATALLTTIVLAWQLAFARERRARTVSAVVTLGFGPLGLAVLMAILSAAVGAASTKVHETTWSAASGGTPLCLARADDWTLHSCGPEITTWNFGVHLLANAIYALTWALVVAGATLVALAAVVAWRWLVGSPTNKDPANRRAASFTRLFGVLESPWTCGALLGAAVVAVYLASSAWVPHLFPWLPHWGSGANGPRVAAIGGGLVSFLLLASKALGLSPSKLAGSGAAPALLRGILDKPYDIATFLREPLGYHGAGIGRSEAYPIPRKRMLVRYRGLLAHLERQGYSRVVFVAHSQGTVLTAALLGELTPDRRPARASLLTFGCPLRQLYAKRFPSQYAWVEELWDPAKRAPFDYVEEWVNVAAADDPIGRTIFNDPPQTWEVGSRHPCPGGHPRLVDVLLGTGGHTSYWKAKELYVELERLIDAPY